MSQLVVGAREGDGWVLDVRDVGTTRAGSLPEVEPAVRALLREHGHADADTRDLQLLLPDFEVDLSQQGVPHDSTLDRSVLSGLILLVVVLAVVIAVLVGLR